VSSAAADAGVSLTISDRSGLPLALMPQCRPLARNPDGAVTPPSIDRLDMNRRSFADGSTDARRTCDVRNLEHHRVLAAVAEQRAGNAVVRDLLRHPGVR